MMLIIFVNLLSLSILLISAVAIHLVEECYGSACTKEGWWCNPSIPGAIGDSWWICCNNTWI